MATLAQLRAKLNDEIGVATDAETAPWTTAQRNAAITAGYEALWQSGVWKDARQDQTTVADQWLYTLTAIRKLYRLELLDSDSRIMEHPRGVIEPDGSGTGAFHVRLAAPIAGGYTLRIRGWAPYASTFAGESSSDDLPAEYNRLPLLKAKAILYRQQLAKFGRYGSRQALPPEMNVSAETLLAMVGAAEREFEALARDIAGQRPRTGMTGRL